MTRIQLESTGAVAAPATGATAAPESARPPPIAVGASHISSGGHGLASGDWLETHFQACLAEYEQMLRSVGLRPGWRVLDAGCGTGSYLPLLTELVGAAGSIAAVDAAPENIAAIQERLARGRLDCEVEPRVGSVTELPFPDDSFHAVWCANVLQYFPDETLPRLLAELRRVVRPGGLVAVKDVDMTLLRIHPADPFLVAHLSEASVRGADGGSWSEGSLRGRVLRRHLERAGLRDAWQRTTLIERWAPLAPSERRLWSEWLAFLAGLAQERGVPDTDLPAWRTLQDPDDPENPVNDPGFYACEGQAVAVGRKPSRVAAS